MSKSVEVITIRRSGPPPEKRHRIIASRDYSAACYEGGHDCIKVDCQCPCHERPNRRPPGLPPTLTAPLSAHVKTSPAKGGKSR